MTSPSWRRGSCSARVTMRRPRPTPWARPPAPGSCSSCSSSNAQRSCPRPVGWRSRSTASRAMSCRCCRSGKWLITTPGEPGLRAPREVSDHLYQGIESWQIRPWIARGPVDKQMSLSPRFTRVAHDSDPGAVSAELRTHEPLPEPPPTPPSQGGEKKVARRLLSPPCEGAGRAPEGVGPKGGERGGAGPQPKAGEGQTERRSLTLRVSMHRLCVRGVPPPARRRIKPGLPLPRRPTNPRPVSQPRLGPRRVPLPPRPSTGSPIGSSFTFHSTHRPASTFAVVRPCSSSGRRSCIGSWVRPGSSRLPCNPAPWPAATSTRLKRARFRDSTRPSTRSGWFESRRRRIPRRCVFTGREYDTATRRLGPLQEHTAFVLADAPRALLQFTLDLFSPTALITGQEGGRALLLIRGASVPPASELGRVVSKGRVFIPLRLVNVKGNDDRHSEDSLHLPASRIPGGSRCPLRDRGAPCATRSPSVSPAPTRWRRWGSSRAAAPSRFRFFTRADNGPAAGYTLTARAVPEGLPHELGMTDRAGQDRRSSRDSPRGWSSSGWWPATSEPMVEFPVMPGESVRGAGHPDRSQAADRGLPGSARRHPRRGGRPGGPAGEAREADGGRLQGEDLAGVEQGLKEYALLPPQGRLRRAAREAEGRGRPAAGRRRRRRC